ncbi:Rhomboid domain-containing protein 3 [Varanus komodoensis]|nr:Rhomboid domain-containing protein 3 [Varanus komodoensis]
MWLRRLLARPRGPQLPPVASSALMLLLWLVWWTGVGESLALEPSLLTSPSQGLSCLSLHKTVRSVDHRLLRVPLTGKKGHLHMASTVTNTGGSSPTAYRLVSYCLCHTDAALLAVNLLCFPLLAWRLERQQGPLCYLHAAAVGAATSALLYLLLAGLCGALPGPAVGSYLPVHLATLGCRQRHGGRSGWAPTALLAGLLLALGQVLPRRPPLLLHLCGLLMGLAGILSQRSGSRGRVLGLSQTWEACAFALPPWTRPVLQNGNGGLGEKPADHFLGREERSCALTGWARIFSPLELSERCLETLCRWTQGRSSLPPFVSPPAAGILPTVDPAAQRERITPPPELQTQDFFPGDLFSPAHQPMPPSAFYWRGESAALGQDPSLSPASASRAPFSAYHGALDIPLSALQASLTNEELLQAGIQASLQDMVEEEVKLSKSSVSSLRLQQLQKMGFPTKRAVVALAATGHVEGAVSLLIGDHVGDQAVVTAASRSERPKGATPGPSQ